MTMTTMTTTKAANTVKKENESDANTAQLQIAYEVLMMDETGKSKASIAREYNVSPSSVSRYAEKYHDEALEMLDLLNQAQESTEAEPEPEKVEAEQTPEPAAETPEVADKAEPEPEVETSSEEGEPQTEEPAEGEEATGEKTETKAPTVDVTDLENRGIHDRYEKRRKNAEKPEGQRGGRKQKRSDDLREFRVEFEEYGAKDQEFIRHVLRKLVYKIGGEHRLFRPVPDAVIAYRDAKGEFEAFSATMVELGYTESAIEREYKRAAKYMFDETI